ncbi:MAG: arsenite methyltransferase [archaeon]
MSKDWFPRIDDARCKKDCFICINFCPQKVYKKEHGIAIVTYPEKCIKNCNSCENICPQKAISFVKTKYIKIDSVEVGIAGLDEAFSKDRFDEAFALIKEKNYIPIAAIDKFKDVLKKEFYNLIDIKNNGETGMKQKEIDVKDYVKKRYTDVAKTGRGCCSSGCGCNPVKQSKDMGYSDEELNAVPKSANLGLGCGNPTALADIKEGETVLDLGSGAGIDAFLAAKKVGKTGKVIGVDMTQAMIEKAKINAKKHGYSNVEFRLGEIENLPVIDNSVDVIISNCVINLTVDKLKTFKEAYRVLKQGGRLLVSDIVTDGKLPKDIMKSFDAWAECIAGAMSKADYIFAIKKAGFKTVIIP